MRLAISNIAWDVSEDAAVAALLSRHAVDAIDIAPGKYFPNPRAATFQQIRHVERWWANHGINITGMQALLFGVAGINLFGDSRQQDAMLDHLGAVCAIASTLGATRLVYGSPKTRDRSGLSDEEAEAMAVDFFRRLGALAQQAGATICVEPNPECYGCNFMTNMEDAARVVRHVAHPAIRLTFDVGATSINQESPAHILRNHGALIGHVHASEPNLVTLGDGGVDHQNMGTALAIALPHHVVAVEMAASATEPHLAAIDRALNLAIRHYRSPSLPAGAGA